MAQEFDIDRRIGRQLRRRRHALGVSQNALAAAIGVRFQQIQKYEAGLNKLSAARLWQVAAALEVSPGYFFESVAQADT
jgi:transcriptional regulator with XRE-family HTH domain